MRPRLIAAAVVLAGTPTLAYGAPPHSGRVQVLRGQWGTVRIDADRLDSLIDQAIATKDADTFVAGLSRNDQIALNYAMAATTFTEVGPCGATVEDCDPPDESENKPDTEVHQAPTPPPGPVCGTHRTVLEAHNAVRSSQVLYTFTQDVYWCYDGFVVSQVYPHAYFTENSSWWECYDDQVHGAPISTVMPPSDAQAVDVLSKGECLYHMHATLVFTVDVGTLHRSPTIEVLFHNNGAWERTGTAGG